MIDLEALKEKLYLNDIAESDRKKFIAHKITWEELIIKTAIRKKLIKPEKKRRSKLKIISAVTD